ncbi:hypothetical protein D9758_015493 [Tetrapyrgos nigripes]|uniref:Uncharacterized protein n=1 Tax=Tetrapyrgos nigripes TaxID=182062 RepID=A0A8H5FCF5_9AGAR|nr:hypothetical protein D9758_015493 [Tetrapyrgos nigripes]
MSRLMLNLHEKANDGIYTTDHSTCEFAVRTDLEQPDFVNFVVDLDVSRDADATTGGGGERRRFEDEDGLELGEEYKECCRTRTRQGVQVSVYSVESDWNHWTKSDLAIDRPGQGPGVV